MPDCAACSLFHLESDGDKCLHVNRPGGLTLTLDLIQLSGLQTGATILEVACGTGTTLQLLRQNEYRVLGLDLSYQMLKVGRLVNPGLPNLQARGEQIPVATASQDAVLIECALGLAGDAPVILQEFKRVLRPGGWLMVTDLYLREVSDPRAVECLASASCLSGAKQEHLVRQAVEQAGFVIQHWQDHTPLLKQWLAGMVFQLGSLQAFYRKLISSDQDAQSLSRTLENGLKLGYYLMAAQSGSG